MKSSQSNEAIAKPDRRHRGGHGLGFDCRSTAAPLLTISLCLSYSQAYGLVA
jgi:hypothetical protein